jgi:DNA-binding response OmpR family regulator
VTIRILLALPDESARSSLQAGLTKAGYACTTARNAYELVHILIENDFDLVILDTQVQASRQSEVVRAVREAAPGTGLILLTEPGAPEAVVQALRYRAQDVIAGPLNVKRVLQSTRRVLQRQEKPGIAEARTETYSVAPPMEPVSAAIDVDFERRLITWDNRSVALTATETHLLRIFFENPGRVLGHAEIVRLVQGFEVPTGQAAGIVRPQISRLRCKLNQVPGGERWIQNVRGVGYIYEPASHL